MQRSRPGQGKPISARRGPRRRAPSSRRALGPVPRREPGRRQAREIRLLEVGSLFSCMIQAVAGVLFYPSLDTSNECVGSTYLNQATPRWFRGGGRRRRALPPPCFRRRSILSVCPKQASACGPSARNAAPAEKSEAGRQIGSVCDTNNAYKYAVTIIVLFVFSCNLAASLALFLYKVDASGPAHARGPASERGPVNRARSASVSAFAPRCVLDSDRRRALKSPAPARQMLRNSAAMRKRVCVGAALRPR